MSSAHPAGERLPAPRPARSVPVPLRRLWPTAPNLAVTGLTADSRLVQPGDLYAAVPGQSHHGAEFVAEALARGAVAVLTDPAGARRLTTLSRPLVVLPDPRAALGEAAAEIYHRPAERLRLLGVTGTNGKTTTAFLAAAALEAAGLTVGVVGTLGFRVNGVDLPGPRTTVTTPEAPELQALLAVMAERGAEVVVMEVSSHALALRRTDPLVFDVAAFTNFGRDHLDFHGDEETYFEAKARLFTPQLTRAAVLNVDDPRGRVLLARVQSADALPVRTVSLGDRGDYGVHGLRLTAEGRSVVSARTPYGDRELVVGLPGDFNVRNALTALAMAEVVGVDLNAAAPGLATAQVPGRMERVDLGLDAPLVLVDFAHTPQAVAAVLAAVTGHRRTVVVVGSGGDRDPAKRGPMGAAAVAADLVVVTDDNPRSEDPATIRAAVLRGAEAAAKTADHPVDVVDGGDRRSAIRGALTAAGPGDVVVILGKGHETGQEIAGHVLPFSDAETAREEWAARVSSTAASR